MEVVGSSPATVSSSLPKEVIYVPRQLSHVDLLIWSTEIQRWNEYEQSECMSTIFSLTTQWNKLKLPQVGF